MSCIASRGVQVMAAALLGLYLLVGTKSTTTTTTVVTSYSLSSPLFQHASTTTRPRRQRPFQSSSSSSADVSYNINFSNTGDNNDNWKATARAFDAAVRNRFACKAFLRFDQRNAAATTATEENTNTTSTAAAAATATASISDPSIVARAIECLEISRLTPSAFNTQPYKVVLVHSPAQRLALSKYCLGPNAKRVLDSDCTAVFLADCKVLQTLPRFGRFMASIDDHGRSPTLLTKVYIALFSSGYPFLPRFVSFFISACVRIGVSFFNIFTSVFFKYPLPTLSSAETWSCKQTTMLAMTYMLACSSRGLATIPMEGINAGGIRAVVGAPRRYAVPVIVSTGLPLLHEKNNNVVVDNDNGGKQRRYPLNEMVFGDSFNQRMQITGAPAASTSNT